MMKHILLYIIFFILPATLLAQISEVDHWQRSGLFIGIEKNKVGYIGYGITSKVQITFLHSMIADKMQYQYFVLKCSYIRNWKKKSISLSPFFSMDYNVSFYNWGIDLSIMRGWIDNKLTIAASLVPYYDTDLKYKTCWSISSSIQIRPDFFLFYEFNVKPEYRISYKKNYIGLSFNKGNLVVKPMLQIPIYDSGFRIDHSKVVLSFGYLFN